MGLSLWASVFHCGCCVSQSRKHRGYASQRLVADYMKANGFPHAESTGAGRAGSDVTGLPHGLDVEVKARRGLVISETLKQMVDRRGNGMQFAVLRLDGQGPKTIGNWPAIILFSDLVKLLDKAGMCG